MKEGEFRAWREAVIGHRPIQKAQAGMIASVGLQLSDLATKVDKVAALLRLTGGRLNILTPGTPPHA